jgi:hypothetical protein
MQGRLTIIGTKDEGVHIEASLECEDILDRGYIKEIISKLLNDNEKEEEANE